MQGYNEVCAAVFGIGGAVGGAGSATGVIMCSVRVVMPVSGFARADFAGAVSAASRIFADSTPISDLVLAFAGLIATAIFAVAAAGADAAGVALIIYI